MLRGHVVAHKNNFGLLRLIFASLVIIGHAPEMIDGNRSREPLFSLSGTMTLGSLAVIGFFLLSGYLITGSMMRTQAIGRYFKSRVLRIYPAFIVAFLASSFVLGPLVGAQVWEYIPQTLAHLVFLQPPVDYPGQFPGMTSYALLNGAMWTIAYEFRCYILIAVLWRLGLLQRRWIVLALTSFSLAMCIAASFHGVQWRLEQFGSWHDLWWVTGDPVSAINFTTAFLVGTCTFLFRDELLPRLSGAIALISLIATSILIQNVHLAYMVLIAVGAPALFWLAMKAHLGPLQKVNDKWDISYGVYLYGWPIATSIRWIYPSVTPIELASFALPFALVAGSISWWGLERWVKAAPRAQRIKLDSLASA
jgi:peptidoglycan/LPS O-acetylase OafA/YrhL